MRGLLATTLLVSLAGCWHTRGPIIHTPRCDSVDRVWQVGAGDMRHLLEVDRYIVGIADVLDDYYADEGQQRLALTDTDYGELIKVVRLKCAARPYDTVFLATVSTYEALRAAMGL
jgi:hypothetical protein